MKTLGQRIKFLREQCAMQQDELSKLIKVNNGVISNWERDINKPNSDKLVLLCKALNTNLSFLLDYNGGDPAQSLTPPGRRIGKAYEKATPPVQKTVEVALEPWIDEKPPAPAPTAIYRIAQPIPDEVEYTELPLHDIPAAAGFGNYLGDEHFELARYRKSAVPQKADFCIRIDGDSMEPDYPDGCVVFVESSPVIESGEVGIFGYDGKAYCKKLDVDHTRRSVCLVSLNREYEPITVSPDTTFWTVGRVLGIAEEE